MTNVSATCFSLHTTSDVPNQWAWKSPRLNQYREPKRSIESTRIEIPMLTSATGCFSSRDSQFCEDTLSMSLTAEHILKMLEIFQDIRSFVLESVDVLCSSCVLLVTSYLSTVVPAVACSLLLRAVVIEPGKFVFHRCIGTVTVRIVYCNAKGKLRLQFQSIPFSCCCDLKQYLLPWLKMQVHVIDASSPRADVQRRVVHDVLMSLGVPKATLQYRMIEVWNKTDLIITGDSFPDLKALVSPPPSLLPGMLYYQWFYRIWRLLHPKNKLFLLLTVSLFVQSIPKTLMLPQNKITIQFDSPLTTVQGYTEYKNPE